MSYKKPHLCLLGPSIKVIEGQQGVPPTSKHSSYFTDGWPYQNYYYSLTIGAYEADE